jgi:RHS repeat-associated protein
VKRSAPLIAAILWIGMSAGAQARYYDPAAGRFITPDTTVQSPYDPQTLNRFAYARNNPINFVDTDGHGILLAQLLWLDPDLRREILAGRIPIPSNRQMSAFGAGLLAFGTLGAAVPEELAFAGAAGVATKVYTGNTIYAASAFLGGGLLAYDFAALEVALGSAYVGEGQAAKGITPLNWSAANKRTGETGLEHVIDQHAELNFRKPVQGVFYGDPVSTINDAWGRAQSQGIQPVPSRGYGLGNDLYLVPYPNAGFAGGYSGQFQNLDYVSIITERDTANLVTGFPGNGMPLPSPGSTNLNIYVDPKSFAPYNPPDNQTEPDQ